MLNATHYDWTKANIRHGLAISRRVGGKHFIINTAENGRGPVHYKSNHRVINVWCNPGLRGLGPAPTTETSNPRADAYLWINRPGYAQSCQGRPIAWFALSALPEIGGRADVTAPAVAPGSPARAHGPARRRRDPRPAIVPRVPETGSTGAWIVLVLGMGFYGMLAVRAARTFLLTRRRAICSSCSAPSFCFVALLPALLWSYM